MGRYKQNYSLFKRGKYWYYRTYNAEGVRTSAKTTGCTLKSEAKIYCDNLYKNGSLWSSSRTFLNYAEHFFDEGSVYLTDRTEPLSYYTKAQYRSTLKAQLLPYFKNKKLSDITYLELKKYRTHLLDQGKTVKSIRSIMAVLKIICMSAYMDNLMLNNPFQYLKPLKSPAAVRDTFTVDELRILIKELPEEQFKNNTIIIALTGMRRNEAGGITREDVRIDNNGNYYIDLNKQYYLNEYRPLKTKKPRTIPVIKEIVDLIQEDPSEMFEYSAAITEIKKGFTNHEERRLCLHSLRHFFISSAKAAEVNPLVVETVAGHSLRGMQQVYTNFKTEDLKSILEWQKKLYDEITH